MIEEREGRRREGQHLGLGLDFAGLLLLLLQLLACFILCFPLFGFLVSCHSGGYPCLWTLSSNSNTKRCFRSKLKTCILLGTRGSL